MSRLAPYRSKAPDAVKQRIEQALATTMYLVQTTGPTSYVVQEQNCDKKHKVLIGSLQTCSCSDGDVCIHILFVMLKVLRVPATTPVVWQKSLIDSEVDALLRGDYREKTRAPPPKNVGEFLKKKIKETVPQTDADEPEEVQRHDLVEGEVCAICQEDMTADQPLTYCRKGCGNNFHIECMKVFGESRKQSKEHIICPLCRHDWGDLALTELKKAMDVANRAPNVHKGVSCKKCQAKPIRNHRYRCIQCKNVDLCDRCFKMNAHINHSFVMKEMVTDAWVPALRPNQQKARSISVELVEELQNRDITTNDYDLLLQLDQGEKYPIQEYLLSTLAGQKVSASNAKSLGDPSATCSICRQSLRIQADVRSVNCGHAFHESCLARSFLSQTYSCPYPGCEHILFPGLHQLILKSVTTENDCASRQPTIGPSGVDMSLSVLPLNNRSAAHKPSQLVGSKSTSKTVSCQQRTSSGSELSHELLSIGLAPMKVYRPSRNDGATADNRTDTRSADLKPAKLRKPHNISHSNREMLPQLAQDVQSTEDRLRHALELRTELKNQDKDRHRKQRILREERVRQNLSNNASNHSALNALLPPIRDTASPIPTLGVAPQRPESEGQLVRREHGARRPSRQNREESQGEGLPALSIGVRRCL